MKTDDLNRLVNRTPAEVKLDPAQTPSALRTKRNTASMTRGEIASPLTETARTYYAARDVVSSDGVFTISYQPIESIAYTDANGKPVVFQYTDPV